MMKNTFLVLLFIAAIVSCKVEVETGPKQKSEFGLVIHGGAGSIVKGQYTAEEEKEFEAKLEEALKVGHDLLKSGSSSLDVVEKVVNILEDSPLFNAGKGSVFTANEINELDASIMDGKTLNVGAVARLTKVKNPISLARTVMEKSKHVMMVGDGAEIFAEQNGFEFVDKKYFFTERRWQSLQRAKANERKEKNEDKHGTVGCVALDKNGNISAATSTGGMTNKKYGRVGDVPIIGAGTYANNSTCGISATGHGEYFIRLSVAKDIAALVEYADLSLEEAADSVIHGKLENLGGTGGIIAIDKYGNVTMPFNTGGMFRGYMLDDGISVVKMYQD